MWDDEPNCWCGSFLNLPGRSNEVLTKSTDRRSNQLHGCLLVYVWSSFSEPCGGDIEDDLSQSLDVGDDSILVFFVNFHVGLNFVSFFIYLNILELNIWQNFIIVKKMLQSFGGDHVHILVNIVIWESSTRKENLKSEVGIDFHRWVIKLTELQNFWSKLSTEL